MLSRMLGEDGQRYSCNELSDTGAQDTVLGEGPPAHLSCLLLDSHFLHLARAWVCSPPVNCKPLVTHPTETQRSLCSSLQRGGLAACSALLSASFSLSLASHRTWDFPVGQC